MDNTNPISVSESITSASALIAKNIQTAAVLGYTGNLFAARIMSAKTDAERNEAIKEAVEILKDFKESLNEQ